ncbi:MAG: hypothetical protein PSV35_06465 [bacterium]|nr:hypothetical protein [bacterium]
MAGILFRNEYNRILNYQNTSFNTINVRGANSVYGIGIYNFSKQTDTHSRFYNNQVNETGPSSTSYGFYFIANQKFRTPARNFAGEINVLGISGNQFSLSSNAAGIYAEALLNDNKITFTPDLNNPLLGVSAVNNNTSYITAGNGVITPKA